VVVAEVGGGAVTAVVAGSLCDGSSARLWTGRGGSLTGIAPATSATKKPKNPSVSKARIQKATCDIRALLMASLPSVDSSRTVTSLLRRIALK
jgi:hypothetical protein